MWKRWVSWIFTFLQNLKHAPESTNCTRTALFCGPEVDDPPRQAWRPPASHYAAGRNRRIWSLAGDCSSASRTAAQTLSASALASTQATTPLGEDVAAAAYSISRQQQQVVEMPTRYQQWMPRQANQQYQFQKAKWRKHADNTFYRLLIIVFYFLFRYFFVAVVFLFALIKVYVQYYFQGAFKFRYYCPRHCLFLDIHTYIRVHIYKILRLAAVSMPHRYTHTQMHASYVPLKWEWMRNK